MGHQRKRQGRRGNREQEPEQVVDDLAVAASFAHALPPSSNTTKEEAVASTTEDSDEASSDENEIEIDDEDSNSDSGNQEKNEEIAKALETAGAEDNASNNSEHESSDDDSEVDLAEALEKMNDSDDEDTGRKKKNASDALSGPTTEHEVDPYKTPVSELESKLKMNLTVENNETTEKVDSETNLILAGNVKSHMVDERTIVVESTTTGFAAPLDEGSLLVLKVDKESNPETEGVLPLGKVFEVFGPVHRPLYTIRLPPPQLPAVAKTATRDEKKGKPSNDQDTECSKGDDGASKTDACCTNDDTEETSSAKLADESETTSMADEAGQTENSENIEQSSKDIEDAWSHGGRYTAMLKSDPNGKVFYVEDKANRIDTAAILRNSGKGCDASNVYDEEAVNANDVYYSDDEQEREAKGRKKKGGKRNEHNHPNTHSGVQHFRPTQHHGGNIPYGSAPVYPQSYQPQTAYSQNPALNYSQQYSAQAPYRPYPPQHAAAYSYQQPAPFYTPMPQGYLGYLPPQMYPNQHVGQPPPPPPPPSRPSVYPNVAVPATAQAQQPGAQPNNPYSQPQEEPDTVYYDYT